MTTREFLFLFFFRWRKQIQPLNLSKPRKRKIEKRIEGLKPLLESLIIYALFPCVLSQSILPLIHRLWSVDSKSVFSIYRNSSCVLHTTIEERTSSQIWREVGRTEETPSTRRGWVRQSSWLMSPSSSLSCSSTTAPRQPREPTEIAWQSFSAGSRFSHSERTLSWAHLLQRKFLKISKSKFWWTF